MATKESKRTVQHIHALEVALQGSTSNANALVELLDLMEPESHGASVPVAALHACRRVFRQFLEEGKFHVPRLAGKQAFKSDAAAVSALQATRKFAAWLQKAYATFVENCIAMLWVEDAQVHLAALRTLMHFVSMEYHMQQPPVPEFGMQTFRHLLRALLAARAPPPTLTAAFANEFANVHPDVRHSTLKCLRTELEKWRASNAGAAGAAAGAEAGADADTESQSSLRRCPADVITKNAFALLSLLKPVTEDQPAADTLVPLRSAGGQAPAAGSEDESADEAAAKDDHALPAAPPEIIGPLVDKSAEARARREAERRRQRQLRRKRQRADSEDGDLPVFQTRGKARRGEQRKSVDDRAADATPYICTVAGFRKEFTACWLELLRLPLERELYKAVLIRLPDHVVPHLTTPLMLADFLTDSYNLGGVEALLALSSLFMLITQHNLDYPQFYPRLYCMLTPETFHAKYRLRFFRLLVLCLASSHLPVYLVAAFIKRMARLTLAVSPGASLFVMPLIYNLLKRHPPCMVLLRRGTGEEEKQALLARLSKTSEQLEAERAAQDGAAAVIDGADGAVPACGEVAAGKRRRGAQDANGTSGKRARTSAGAQDTSAAAPDAAHAAAPGVDPFDATASDPAQCRALDSSLWELASLRSHYCPAVAELAAMFEEKMDRPAYPMDEFMQHTYSGLVDAEVSRKVKKPPALAIVVPPGVLRTGEEDVVGALDSMFGFA